MAFTLPELSYGHDALQPHLSAETIDYHYGKHHRAYVENLNKLVAGTEYENMTLEEIINKAEGPIFNNAAQVWNHNFYWSCLSPGVSSTPIGPMALAIKKYFGGIDEFKQQFTQAALSNFGSGWTWLVKKPGGILAIENTSNADTPIARGDKPLLTCDVWEHAYYIDYRNARAQYVENFWELVDWEYITQRLMG